MNITGNALVVGGGKYLLGSTVTTITDIGILILTGRGIGQACAILLAKEGVSGILVADMVVEAARDTISECQAVATNRQFQGKAFPVDVTQEDSVRSLFNEMTSAFGRIDYCVNCAGVSEELSSFEHMLTMSFFLDRCSRKHRYSKSIASGVSAVY